MAQTRRLADADVFPIGLGGMPMSLSGRPPEERSIRTIHAALDAGVNVIDTADSYARDESEVGHNERLIAKALRGRRDGVIVATKGGHTRPGGGWALDGRPEHLRAACEASLRALETDRIDLYQYHRPDPDVPYAESIGALRDLQAEGKVPWSPLGGISSAADAAGRHDPVRAAADAHDVSPQQVALAWLLSLSPVVIPIPGASRPESIADSVQAVELELTGDALDTIGGIASAAR